MELKLEKFIDALVLTTDIHNQNEAPIIVRITDDATGISTVFCCGYNTPKYVLLPVNAIWIDMHPESDTYKTAYKRTTKGATPDGDVWEALYFYADAFDTQSYDESDLSMVSISLPSPATTLTHGIGYLTTAQGDSLVVVEGDERLTDKRNPLAHTHAEKPATMIQSESGVHSIDSQTTPQIGDTLVFAESTATYKWRAIAESDISMEG